MKLVFNMIWSTICQEEQLHIKYYVINHFNISKNLKLDGYQRSLASMVHNIFDKKNTSGGAVGSEIIPNQQLAEELHKPVNRKVENEKCTHFLDDVMM